MQYEQNFSASFMRRTLCNLEGYQGNYEATQTVNSLLGLLIVPTEKLFNQIPDTDLAELDQTWGNVSEWVTNPGKCDHGHAHPLTLRQLVRRQRNAVAHFDISAYPASGDIQGFTFKDRGGFAAEIPVVQLRNLVKKLAEAMDTSTSVGA